MANDGIEVFPGSTLASVILSALINDGLSLAEQPAEVSTPAAGERVVYAMDGGYLAEKDDADYQHALAWAAGNVVLLPLPTAIARTKAGTFSDTDTNADGFLGVDKTNGRVYFRAGGTWYWLPRSTIVALLDGSQAFTGEQTFNAGAKLLDPLIAQEKTTAAADPASGYRKLYPRDAGDWVDHDDDGHEHALAWAAGNVARIDIEPVPAMWQHADGATGSSYGAIRVEAGRGTLVAGTLAVTFQQAFKTILEVFLQDKTGANAMYPSGLSTTGFTANGTTTDAFAWLAIGVD